MLFFLKKKVNKIKNNEFYLGNLLKGTCLEVLAFWYHATSYFMLFVILLLISHKYNQILEPFIPKLFHQFLVSFTTIYPNFLNPRISTWHPPSHGRGGFNTVLPFRICLVCGIRIPLWKKIIITGNKRKLNGITIHIL